MIDPDFTPLVADCRGGTVRREEMSAGEDNTGDATRHGNPIDMNIQGRQENADLLPRTGRRDALLRRSGDDDTTVGRGQYRISGMIRPPVGITKEEEKECPEEEDGHRQRPADSRRCGRQNEGANDEGDAGGVDSRADQLRTSAPEASAGPDSD